MLSLVCFLDFLSACDADEILLAYVQEFLLCIITFVCTKCFFAFGASFSACYFDDGQCTSQQNFGELFFV